MKVLVTGGAGFIGSAVVRNLVCAGHHVVNLDKLTYAGNLDSVATVAADPKYAFEQCDIVDTPALNALLTEYQPDAVMHLAAESHVDRSIDGPEDFIQTNVVGTFSLLRAAYRYWGGMAQRRKSRFRFHHVSTDEVYGDRQEQPGSCDETTPYAPSSPYAASKAASDHLVRAWHRTFGLPVVISNCSNNYGPYQFPEKLIPHMILNALHGRPLPVYGDGRQVRDWLYVEDHARGLIKVLMEGRPGETYNFGAAEQRQNIAVVELVCDLLDEMAPAGRPPGGSYRSHIAFVADRPGHDRRYAIDAGKVARELGWTPMETFESGLRKTVQWYLANREWWQRVLSGDYRLERVGL